ncbi:MAPEG family [Heterobasidion irregulare TC 32-1]|uniref:MAPEG family n=1 Tax=Heterobasidion irregulare (strain TC 32-1) TaxID=747525 RepID=W4KML3_HETIT|nr:MAPEG family [Heterobasidion irregulare TC 32-1]ETW87083.1 MAPEG family [Heterobasidion irregulare TC 32-1]
MSTIILPEGTSYVAAGLLSTTILLAWQSIVVSKARKSAKIEYPRLYAEKAEQDASIDALKFNCAQRAHQNTLENMPIILTTSLVTALSYPKLAGVACGCWSVARVLYTSGYATGDPKKRQRGGWGSLILLGLLASSGKAVYDLFMAGI